MLGVLKVVGLTVIVLYFGIANYCRFKISLGLPATHCAAACAEANKGLDVVQ